MAVDGGGADEVVDFGRVLLHGLAVVAGDEAGIGEDGFASIFSRQRCGVRWQRGKAQALCPDDTAVESGLSIRTCESLQQRRRRCRAAPASLPPHSTTLARMAERQG